LRKRSNLRAIVDENEQEEEDPETSNLMGNLR
jgi:hypothetical protein